MEEIYFKNKGEWRSWLESNHVGNNEGIWVVYFKKKTKIPSLSYDESVEEALCFGWIDSLIRKLDDEKYCMKFTPRKESGAWSESNKRRVEKLIKNGRMTAAGMSKVEAAKKSGRWDEIVKSPRKFSFPIELKIALKGSKKAAKFFESLPLSAKNEYINWIASAKMTQTRKRRAGEAIELLNQKERLGLR